MQNFLDLIVPLCLKQTSNSSVIFVYVQEFLKTRFRRQTDITTTKSRVCEVVHADFDSNATASLVGRAIGKAFGKKIHNKGSKM